MAILHLLSCASPYTIQIGREVTGGIAAAAAVLSAAFIIAHPEAQDNPVFSPAPGVRSSEWLARVILARVLLSQSWNMLNKILTFYVV